MLPVLNHTRRIRVAAIIDEAFADHPLMQDQDTITFIDSRTEKTSNNPALHNVIDAGYTFEQAVRSLVREGSTEDVWHQDAGEEARVQAQEYSRSFNKMFAGTPPITELDETIATLLRVDAMCRSSEVGAPPELPPVDDVLLRMSASQLEALYHHSSSDGSGSRLREYLLREGPEGARYTQRAQIMARIYESRGGLDHLEPGIDPLADNIIDTFEPAALTILCLEEEPRAYDRKTIKAFNKRALERIDRFLTKEVPMPQDAIDRFYAAASSRLYTKPKRIIDQVRSHIDSDEVTRGLAVIYNRLRDMGKDKMDVLFNEAGLINVDNYSLDELKRLWSLFDNSPEAQQERELMKQKEVRVIFVDGNGDYNGVFNDVSQAFASEEANIIKFDITRPEQFYRFMAVLKKHSIKPSSVVLSAHGSLGVTAFGKGKEKFNLVTRGLLTSIFEKGIDIRQLNLTRLFSDEFMRSDSHGKRTLYLDSCSGAGESLTVASVAETLLTQIGRQDTEVYAPTTLAASEGTLQYGLQFLDHKSVKKGTPKSNAVRLNLVPSKPEDVHRRPQLNVRREAIESFTSGQ